MPCLTWQCVFGVGKAVVLHPPVPHWEVGHAVPGIELRTHTCCAVHLHSVDGHASFLLLLQQIVTDSLA